MLNSSSALSRPTNSLRRIPVSLWLVLCGVVMLGLYAFAFTARYPLTIFGNQPHENTATLNKLNPSGAIIYIGAFAILFLLYAICAMRISAAQRLSPPKDSATWRNVLLILGGGIAFNIALVPMYPIEANDIYDYIIRGRMTAFYGLNPLVDSPNQIAGTQPEGAEPDLFLRFAAWTTVPTAYGAGWELIAAGLAKLAGDNYLLNIYLFKGIAIVGYVLAVLGIAFTLQKFAPDRLALGVIIFAWNPFLITMVGGGGHNDILMVAFMALSMCFFVRRWFVLASLAAIAGAAIKFIALLIIVIIGIIAFRTLKPRQFVQYCILTALFGVIMLGAVYAPFYKGIGITDLLDRRTRLYTSTSWAVVRQTLIPLVDKKPADASPSSTPATNAIVVIVGYFLLATFSLWQCVRVWRKPTILRAMHVITLILAWYLVVVTTWFQSWYVLWMIVLAALLPDTGVRRWVVVFSYLVTWQHIVYVYVTLRSDGWAPLPYRDLVPVAIFMGGAYMYAFWLWFHHRRQRLALDQSAVTS